MQKILYVLIFIILFTFYLSGLEGNDWLYEEDAVVMSDQNIFTITDSNEGIYEKNITIRINNEDGKDLCKFVILENHFISTENIEGLVKDTSGNIIKELDDDDIIESTFTLGTTLHSDALRKFFILDHFEYPFIINVTFEQEISSLFLWPPWVPQKEYPVLKSSYRLIMEEFVQFNTYAKGINKESTEIRVNDKLTHSWQVDSIPGFPDETLMPPEEEVQYYLLFSPHNFATDDIAGSLTTWNSFAEWYRRLCTGKYILPQKLKDELNQICNSLSSKREIVELLYTYLQDKTRYVAIELGVGSWQPYSAEEVYKTRYGDCKDLTTFMIAILKHAGIKAYPALIKTRENGVVHKEFPFNYFNHVITFVPLEKDTIWLEVTADHLLAGDLPWGNEGCNVFVITENSGEIIQTPISKSHENAWKSKIEGEITSKGDFYFSGKVHLYGNQRESISYKHNYYKSYDFEDWLRKRIGEGIPGLNLAKYGYTEPTRINKAKSVLSFEGNFIKFGSKIGSRFFINPNILNIRSNTSLEEVTDRNYPIHLSYAYADIDTVSIKLPIGYTLEAAPEATTLETPFARYHSSHKIENDVFIYFRHFEYKSNFIPKDQYSEVVKFINAVIKKDQTKYVFKKM